ncbi:MarR family EPS-associated transcriptional regulator [Nitrosophilus alvini]|uniref:MarR family EPS-associated transcriptional regulator n=1 Tax=Nitrosophilus alvini TaxID=2714855 RepID=UPI00190A21D0|nr:MarR family EPS-associated transcriptional regulator [Nitrosophilus alvini]
MAFKEKYEQELSLSILREIENIPDQKSLAQSLGCSVGKTNYIIKELVKKGLVKTKRFIKSNNKKGYRYLLTKKGLEEKIRLTKVFIEIKKKEYEELQRELYKDKI